MACGCGPGDSSADVTYLPPLGAQDTSPFVRPEAASGSGGGPQTAASPSFPGRTKSYLDLVEAEPPLSTGSIFATGYSNPGLDGLGGNLNQTAWAELLGLGLGDLTVLVVFDRSISMADTWEGSPKWEVAGQALIDSLSGIEEQVTIGALFFPQAAQCDVAPLTDPRQIQLQDGVSFRENWESYPQNRFPVGGTPLGAAMEEVDRALEVADQHGLLTAGRRFRVVVVTDGQPNCGTDSERVLFLAADWRSRDIEVHVIGLPGSEEAAGFLDLLAARGGTQQTQTPTSPDEARDTFVEIVR